MPDPSDIKFMTTAYGLLFEIETTLTELIRSSLAKQYGLAWERFLNTNRPLSSTLFHDKVSYFGKFAALNQIFSREEIKKLYALNYTRNKIAHMEIINVKDFTQLRECHKLVTEKLKKIMPS